jgi:hypothetical protein
MSELLQSGRHPDADQLSAFIEHALPAHEYQQTLAHLAECAHCRTIVSLSLPSVDEPPVLQAKPVRRSWFSGWNLAWPAVAAVLATLAAFVVYIHNTITPRRAGTTTQIAESHEPAATERQSISTPEPPPSQDSKPQRNDRRVATAQGAGGGGSIPLITGSAHEAQSKSALALQSPSVPGLLRPAPPTGRPAANGTAQLQNPPGTAVDHARQNALRAGSTIEASPSASEATAAAIANAYGQSKAATASPSRAGSEAAAFGASGQTVQLQNTTPVAALSTTTNADLPNQAQSVVAQQPLPSHLPALSMISSGKRVLAIDTQNTLFFSDDAGNHWKAIPSTWEGRAVKVELVSSTIPSGQSSATVTGKPHSGLGGGAMGGILGSLGRVTSSTLTGTVKDTSGAVIEGASVVVSNSTTVASPSKTDSAGRYVYDLAPGTYQVEVLAPGFEKQQIAVTLTASQQTVTNFTLSVGQVSQSVTVGTTASPPTDISRARKQSSEPPLANEPLRRFEITTDTGERWTSTDGQIWTHR